MNDLAVDAAVVLWKLDDRYVDRSGQAASLSTLHGLINLANRIIDIQFRE